MERRFSMNDFEQSLKEHADDFKMIPSKRVWHGIYNDLHPGRRWPSIAVSLLLISTLIIVGHLNNRSGSQIVGQKSTTSVHAEGGSNQLPTNTLTQDNNTTASQTNLTQNSTTSSFNSQSEENVFRQSETVKTNSQTIREGSLVNVQRPTTLQNAAFSPYSTATSQLHGIALLSPLNKSDLQTFNPEEQYNSGLPNPFPDLQNAAAISDYNFASVNSAKEKIGVQPDRPAVNIPSNNTYAEKELVNKSVLANSTIDKKNLETSQQVSGKNGVAKLHKKRNSRINWVYFIAPELNSVSFRGEPIRPMPSTNSPAVAINQKDYRLFDNSAFGFEFGAQLNYSVRKKFQFTSGLQLNYSGYKITSNEVHPTYSTLILRDQQTGIVYAKNYLTHYGDGTGQAIVIIRNYSLQASLPVGLQYQFAGNNKVQFSAGANIAPSLIVKSNAYLLSSDGSNYIKDPTLLRKWNMSSNFNVAVTFTSKKLKWQVGPDVRYQWLSTYKKDYTVQEHLIDYGLRIGISR